MRIFALSDVHVDYAGNARWVAELSLADYRDDILILAGDVTDDIRLLEQCLQQLAKRFRQVLFVPGNHDLWVVRERHARDSMAKLQAVVSVAENSGASMQPYCAQSVSIVPLLGWYDYSFGAPSEELKSVWMDFFACSWPAGFGAPEIARHFTDLNTTSGGGLTGKIITFSHFLPRIDLMPDYIPHAKRFLYPVLGSTRLEDQLRRLESSMHIYGHSHVNRRVTLNGVLYINNAFGYPAETSIASKRLLNVYEC